MSRKQNRGQKRDMFANHLAIPKKLVYMLTKLGFEQVMFEADQSNYHLVNEDGTKLILKGALGMFAEYKGEQKVREGFISSFFTDTKQRVEESI